MSKKGTWGGWAKNRPKKDVKKRMKAIAKKRMSKLTLKERKAIGRKLTAARLAKKNDA